MIGKRIVCASLFGVLALGMVGCSNTNSNTSKPSDKTTQKEEEVKTKTLSVSDGMFTYSVEVPEDMDWTMTDTWSDEYEAFAVENGSYLLTDTLCVAFSARSTNFKNIEEFKEENASSNDDYVKLNSMDAGFSEIDMANGNKGYRYFLILDGKDDETYYVSVSVFPKEEMDREDILKDESYKTVINSITIEADKE